MDQENASMPLLDKTLHTLCSVKQTVEHINAYLIYCNYIDYENNE